MTAFTAHLLAVYILYVWRLSVVQCLWSVACLVVVGISWICVVGRQPGGDARGVLLLAFTLV